MVVTEATFVNWASASGWLIINCKEGFYRYVTPRGSFVCINFNDGKLTYLDSKTDERIEKV